MIKLYTVLLLLLFPSFCFCQNTKTSVAIMPFQHIRKEDDKRASQLQEIVLGILAEKNSINTLDRSKDQLVDAELVKQMDESFIASKSLVAQGKKFGAQHILLGTLSNVEVEKQSTSSKEVRSSNKLFNMAKKVVSGSENYKASLSYSLQLVDVETGKVISQRTFNKTSKSVGISFVMLGSGSSEEEAIVNAINSSKETISKWIDEVYPNKIKIVKIEERNRDGEAKLILVTGLSNNIEEGTEYVVLDIEMLDGHERKKDAGVLSYVKNEGDFSICKVIDGASFVESKLNSYITLKSK